MPCDVSSTFTPSTTDEPVNGVWFMPQITPGSQQRVRVVLKGDYIRDEHGKGIDVDDLPPWFPASPSTPPTYHTGNGVAGGTFESWFTLKPA